MRAKYYGRGTESTFSGILFDTIPPSKTPGQTIKKEATHLREPKHARMELVRTCVQRGLEGVILERRLVHEARVSRSYRRCLTRGKALRRGLEDNNQVHKKETLESMLDYM